jgi:hypothetical protein
MANLFKNYTVSCTNTTETTVYTVPAATTAVVIGCNVANTGAASLTIDVKVAGKYLIKGAPVPVGSALSVLDGKIIGEATDTVTITSSDASGDVDVIVSVLEQT